MALHGLYVDLGLHVSPEIIFDNLNIMTQFLKGDYY